MLEDDQATFIGFIGVALLLAAFLLNLFRLLRSDGHLYMGLNFVGASLACYSSLLSLISACTGLVASIARLPVTLLAAKRHHYAPGADNTA